MKHRSAERIKYEKSPRRENPQAVEKLRSSSAIIPAKMKKLIYGISVAVALFGPNGGIDSKRVREVLPIETVKK